MRLMTYLIAALLFASGSVYAEQKPKKALLENATVKTVTNKKSSVISGQVFIVTRGGQSIKLALVEVSAIPENEMLQYIKAKSSVILKQRDTLMPDLKLAEEEVKQALDEKKVANNRYSKAATEMYDDRKYSHIPWQVRQTELDQAKAGDKAAKEEFEKKSYASIKLKMEFDIIGSALDYFYSKPSGVSISKTDADGKFQLTLPAGKYALAATASRYTPGPTANNEEHYYWMVWVDTSSQNQTLMLSNDNLFETRCNDCVQPSTIKSEINNDNFLNKNLEVAQRIELSKPVVLADVFARDYIKSHPINENQPDQRERLRQESIQKVFNELRTKAKIETIAPAGTAALVNGIPIPQARIDLRIKDAVEEGSVNSPELRKAILEDMINIEVMAQEAVKVGLSKNDNVIQRLVLTKQLLLVAAFTKDHLKNHPISEDQQDQRERLQQESLKNAFEKLRAKAKIRIIASAETAALVNGVPIPQARIDLRIEDAAAEGKVDSPELRKDILARTINLEVTAQEAVKRGLDQE